MTYEHVEDPVFGIQSPIHNFLPSRERSSPTHPFLTPQNWHEIPLLASLDDHEVVGRVVIYTSVKNVKGCGQNSPKGCVFGLQPLGKMEGMQFLTRKGYDFGQNRNPYMHKGLQF